MMSTADVSTGLSRNGQPDHILANPIISHKAERPRNIAPSPAMH